MCDRYEKFKNRVGNSCYAVAGYCTVYEYYAYPDRKRPRVSQMLVLPPFQRRGLGARLLCTVYQHYRRLDSVLDITGKLLLRSAHIEFIEHSNLELQC